MKCKVCNKTLTDNESTKKYDSEHPLAGEYIDTCFKCLDEIRKGGTDIYAMMENLDDN
jgi:hypothetical protein